MNLYKGIFFIVLFPDLREVCQISYLYYVRVTIKIKLLFDSKVFIQLKIN